jgi:hypothetical protein
VLKTPSDSSADEKIVCHIVQSTTGVNVELQVAIHEIRKTAIDAMRIPN